MIIPHYKHNVLFYREKDADAMVEYFKSKYDGCAAVLDRFGEGEGMSGRHHTTGTATRCQVSDPDFREIFFLRGDHL